MDHRDQNEQLRNAALAIIALGVVLVGLIYGRGFLIPLAIAILLWNLLGAVIERFAQIRIGEFQLPRCWASPWSSSASMWSSPFSSARWTPSLRRGRAT